jgi:hypothetical protein
VSFTLEALRTGLYLDFLREELLSIAGMGDICLNDTADEDAADDGVVVGLASHPTHFLLEVLAAMFSMLLLIERLP